MKTRFLAIAVAVFSLAVTSCQTKLQPVYYTEYNNDIETVLINVAKTDWSYTNTSSNNYFYASVNMPEITESVFDTGLVKMYRVYNFDKTTASQIELPFVRHSEYCDYVTGNWLFYTETVDYEFYIGKMLIYYTASDFDYELDESFVPDAMQFRCVIMK